MRASLLLLAVSVGCGDVRSGGNLGDPIWTLQADLQGVALGEPTGQHRALFGWLSFGEGDLFDCLEESNVLLCGLRTGYQHELQLAHTDVRPIFPSGLEVEFLEFPEGAQLLSRDGAVLAVGGLGIYDDRNLNGELDPIGPDDPQPIDRVVAESVTLPNVRSLALYREGPVHPMWNAFRDVYGCPEPPEGFSVGRLFDGVCQVSRSTRLLVTASNDDQTERMRCGFGTGPLNSILRSRSLMPLPDNAVVECKSENRLVFYLDEGNFCDRFNTTEYVLDGAAPEWWPCQ